MPREPTPHSPRRALTDRNIGANPYPTQSKPHFVASSPLATLKAYHQISQERDQNNAVPHDASSTNPTRPDATDGSQARVVAGSELQNAQGQAQNASAERRAEASTIATATAPDASVGSVINSLLIENASLKTQVTQLSRDAAHYRQMYHTELNRSQKLEASLVEKAKAQPQPQPQIDLESVVRQASSNYRLDVQDERNLSEFANLDTKAMLIHVNARQMADRVHLNKNVATLKIDLPQTRTRLRTHCSAVLLSPHLKSYEDGLLPLLVEYFEKNLSELHLPPRTRNDIIAWAELRSLVQKEMTAQRLKLLTGIQIPKKGSAPDIVALAHSVVNKDCSLETGVYDRLAHLRQTLLKWNDLKKQDKDKFKDFWDYIDRDLRAHRANAYKLPEAERKDAMAQVFKRALALDMATFPLGHNAGAYRRSLEEPAYVPDWQKHISEHMGGIYAARDSLEAFCAGVDVDWDFSAGMEDM
ncbi:hypothetical protein SISNIDRAFT_452899 [Sistotremastrum niveocremeum HHB9708]|uniref:Uncharacterized protein n=1 Tax=Sistotremastrum niveocremeum HHB9708 TaxID=1314777 RepID=A0A164W6M6_9AGAM|nr:hypothetical protein SISNIDRAFT_452899 [Sistotremastrum niveocremeum HHB9708]